METSTKTVQCVVVTPERTVLDEAVDFVALPLYDGEVGVLPGRAPLIGRLGAGELRTVNGAKVNFYYLDGGFVQVRANVVTVLTPNAVKAEAIDVAKVEAQMEAARAPAASLAERDAQQQVLAKGRVQLHVAAKRKSTIG